MPDSFEMPAPASTTVSVEPASRSTARSIASDSLSVVTRDIVAGAQTW